MNKSGINAAAMFAAAGIGLLFIGGCTPEARQDYSAAGDKATQAMKEDAAVTGKVLQQDAAKLSVSAKNATTTGQVKSALLAAKDLDASNINIDTDGNTVTMKGTVPTAEEKHRAVDIAKQQLGPNYKLNVELGVAPKKS